MTSRIFNPKATGIGIVLFSAFLIGMAPNAAKIAYLDGANPLTVICFRTFIGAIGLALFLALRRDPERSPPGNMRKSAVAGFAQVLTALGFLGAVAFIDVTLAALIFYLHPFLIAAIGHLRGEARMTPVQFACIAAAIAGLGLVLGVRFSSLDPVGLGLSILGMLAITLLIFSVADVSKAIGPVRANFQMTLWSSLYLAAIIAAASVLGWSEAIALPVSVTGWIAIIGTGVTTTAGYVLFFVGARLIGTTRAAIWTITEPLFAIFVAVLLINEHLTVLQWIGVAIVIASLFRFEVPPRKREELAD